MSTAISLILVFVAIVYLRGARRVTQPWRTASFLAGLVCTWTAVASPVAYFDGRMLTAHMIQHLLLMTFAPPLLWLGAPVMPLRHSLPALSTLPRRAVFRWLGGFLGNPAVCWLSAAAALVIWHVPALLRLGMESTAWHLVEHASFLFTGLLFWWPVVQPWPSVPRWPRWSMLLYLFLATLPCDVLAGLLVFSDRVAYPVYLCTPHQAGFSALEDQQCAGALMWTCVTLVFLVAGTILSTQLLSPRSVREVVQA
ncbi:MAG TPA: cytochrome c oxidase assembly protein [Candidatus Solibacter sp.]|nr:cytochrome c oxidase assembly protein [Candidatus Solibacter sp.]